MKRITALTLAVLTAAGILIARPAQADDAKKAADQAKQSANEAGKNAGDAVKNAGDAAKNAGEATKDAARDAARDAKKKLVTDESFAVWATSGGNFEVRSGELALQHAKAEDVKQFARQQVEDHTKANRELMTILDQKKVAVPKEMQAKHQQELVKLQNAGENFDRTWIRCQTVAHDETICLFEGEAENGKDADLKAFASKTLPTLRMHLKHLTEMDKQVGSAR